MAEDNPDLQVALEQLDRELEEGDITQKGYEKRRTNLLSQYLDHSRSEYGQNPGLRIHSPENTAHPSNTSSRTVSLAQNLRPAARGPNTSSFQPIQSINAPITRRDSDVSRLDTMNTMVTAQTEFSSGTSTPAYNNPQNHTGRFQESYSGTRGVNTQYGHTASASQASMLSPPNNAANHNGISPEPTMTSDTGYAFNPSRQSTYAENPEGQYIEQSRAGTMLDSQQGFFSDFAGQQALDARRDSYGGHAHRYSSSEAFSPSAAMAPPMLSANDLPSLGAYEHQMPLEPREVPFAIFDPHNTNLPMTKFDNIASVLRHRSRTIAKRTAYWVLDQKGKETSSITWDKFGSRAEKVAQVIRDKSNLYRGDRVALLYRDTELIEFAVALMGCFIAGVVAVPINDLEDYPKLNVILTTTQSHLALTTENNLRTFQRDITLQKLTWPRGVEWWKTNEFGGFHPKKKEDIPPLAVPDLAYIEFSRAPTGDLRGVVMSHRTIMHQMAILSAIISSVPTNESTTDTFNSGLRDKQGRLLAGANAGEVLLSYLDSRQSIGLILGVLLAVYSGNTTVWMEPKAVDTHGLYAHLITKYKATLMLADYPGLKRAAYNYQQDPLTTRNYKKNLEPNFSSVKLCLIESLTVDGEFHEILADRWLRPLRNTRARELVCPMLCLPEHGGMVISMRDWVGGQENMGFPMPEKTGAEPEEKKLEIKDSAQNGHSLLGGRSTEPREKQSGTELTEVLLDKEALKTNEVVVLATGDEARKRSGELNTVRLGAFGYPIPDATLAIVDPETSLLCRANVVGEIWVDSPSLSGGFWALPKHTEAIFHARPYHFEKGQATPTAVEPEFLRTGLLGCVLEGKLFILGLYEDRLRQKVEWVESDTDIPEYRYFFVQHLIVSIMKNIGPKVYDCSAFDVFVNEEHLPIVVLESMAASTAPVTSGGPPRQLDTALLDSLCERCIEILFQEHHLRVYCVMITAPNSLPRTNKNGRREIGNMLCRRDFDLGTLPCVHVKFGVERAVLNLPIGVDPIGGIWSPISTRAREQILHEQEKQYSGVDYREVVIDDRTSTPLNNFSSIVDLLQWRVARQAEELSYCTIDGRGKEGKGITWKKLDTKIAAVAMYLKNKAKVKVGDHLILMYTHSEDYVYAIHACFCLGVVAIPLAPLDQNRLGEDAPAFLHIISDFNIKAILVNNDVEHLFKQKVVAQHLKSCAQVLNVAVPNTFNTTKPPKQTNGCRDLNLTMKPEWVHPSHPVLVWIYWTPDQRRIAVQLGHDTIMGTCKVQKETCQMTSSRPVLGCVRSTIGLGFVHTCLMGVFVGAPTYLVSPLDFAQNPVSLFLTLSRYKIKDTYATSQMLDHAMMMMPGKGFTLHELKNLMISTEGRPRVDVFQKVRLHFSGTGLDRTAINTIYSHVLNPMVASRSYMCIEPIELWLDTQALRRGLIYPVDPDVNPSALLVQDSGMVPVSTQIAIVNPENCRLCHIGEFGEIWVQSEACVKSFYGSKDAFDAERFNGRTVDGDPKVRYVRTGDLGFLHNVSRPIGPNGAQVDMQILFVLGAIGETFEVNGLSHFPMDIEYSVEKCHRNIVPNGCAVFQAGGLVVVLVEVVRKAYLASIVPVIVNAILNEHQLVVDIVAFVSQGDFPRSRLMEKQRGKILATWVTRKIRTIAQFSIRDSDVTDSRLAEVAEPAGRISGSTRLGSAPGSLVNIKEYTTPSEKTEVVTHPQQYHQPPAQFAAELSSMDYGDDTLISDGLPTGISEMPSYYSEPIPESSGPPENSTPTTVHNHHFELADNTSQYYDDEPLAPPSEYDFPPRVSPNLALSNLPSVTGRESLIPEGDIWTLPSQQHKYDSRRAATHSAPEEEWPQEAIMHMNLTSRSSPDPRKESRNPPPPPPPPPVPAPPPGGYPLLGGYGSAI
ncbi:MAG: hypothetical protein M1829_005064 [Trizodia sp. TS-e1964]|nr:MAG: hypothetical protein M1829_005064 [Trizodia sp. TS-e1964]